MATLPPMEQPASDIVFRETLSGPLALGETDPREGAGRGRQSPFTVRATLRVDDLDAFLQDRQHAARLEGNLSYAPLGRLIRVTQGRFHLLKANDTPDTRLMTYGLTFGVGGRTYHLEGTKTLHDGAGATPWRDATRLYCLLHEGSDARGAVVGAGVLTLGVQGMLGLIRGMHSERREGRAEAEALARFGRFFLGPLWDAYAPRAYEEDPSEEAGDAASW